jgi:hypothetical protein
VQKKQRDYFLSFYFSLKFKLPINAKVSQASTFFLSLVFRFQIISGLLKLDLGTGEDSPVYMVHLHSYKSITRPGDMFG